jgi:2-hydroxychromene-2-carboxylate isomerase
VPPPTFYYDLGSPFAWLSAERLAQAFDGPVMWQPISLGALFKANGRSSWALTPSREEGMADVEARARRHGLPPLRWPDPWPAHYLMAMRAATHAFGAGRGREFTMQAFRDAFTEGRDLSVPANVLAAAERAGLDPAGVERATQDPDVKLALREATEAAHARGVFGVPTFAVGDELLWGDDRLGEAAALARGGVSRKD